MKKTILIIAASLIMFSCTRVEPNYVGVLMENYGKEGKSDFSQVKGSVYVAGMGTALYQVPLFEQRANFQNEDGSDRELHLKSADNTEFTAKPLYSYEVIEDSAVSVVFNNKHLDTGDDFMRSLEDNILEPHIYDIIKEESRKYITDSLMGNGGSLKFEQHLQDTLVVYFRTKGLRLTSFSAMLEFSEKVKDKIDLRNEVNTNISVLDQQILEQKKRNELAELKAQENLIISKGITPQLLQQQFIEKWDGKTPLYFAPPQLLQLMDKK